MADTTLRPAPAFDLVAVGASAGGVDALGIVLGGVPAGFPSALAVVQHLDPRHKSMLAEIMDRRCSLPVSEATDGQAVVAGTVTFAPPARHMLINMDRTITLTRTELVNFVRPSADLLFESVAATYGERAIAVVLTGSGHDGALGVTAIKKRGGSVIIEDPMTAAFASMPQAAWATGCVDLVLPIDRIADTLVRLVSSGSAG